MASVNGSEKAISYVTDTMGGITVMGGKSSPVEAAAAMLKDLINAPYEWQHPQDNLMNPVLISSSK